MPINCGAWYTTSSAFDTYSHSYVRLRTTAQKNSTSAQFLFYTRRDHFSDYRERIAMQTMNDTAGNK